MAKTIHDNEILAYKVDFREESIGIETVNYNKEIILVKFEGLLVHYFEMVMPNSIIFDIDEYEGRKVIKEKKTY